MLVKIFIINSNSKQVTFTFETSSHKVNHCRTISTRLFCLDSKVHETLKSTDSTFILGSRLSCYRSYIVDNTDKQHFNV